MSVESVFCEQPMKKKVANITMRKDFWTCFMCKTLGELGSVHHNPPLEVIVQSELAIHHIAAKELRNLFPNKSGDALIAVYFNEEGVELRNAAKPKHKGFKVDFLGIDRRTGAGNLSRKQPLPKAIGQSTNSVIDVTAGFCSDAFRLAMMGYKVTALERSPVIATLVEDGIRRAKEDNEFWLEFGARFHFVRADILNGYDPEPHDVAYLDPMFPPKRKKSALPPGPIQRIQSLVGFDNPKETRALFQRALEIATKKVVLKRPTYAQELHQKPAHVFEGKLVRYEVYLQPTVT